MNFTHSRLQTRYVFFTQLISRVNCVDYDGHLKWMRIIVKKKRQIRVDIQLVLSLVDNFLCRKYSLPNQKFISSNYFSSISTTKNERTNWMNEPKKEKKCVSKEQWNEREQRKLKANCTFVVSLPFSLGCHRIERGLDTIHAHFIIMYNFFMVRVIFVLIPNNLFPVCCFSFVSIFIST